MKRRIEITVETTRVLLAERRSVAVTAWCASCEGRVRMLTPEEAARLARTSARAIYRRVEEEKLHFAETEEGDLLICRDSL